MLKLNLKIPLLAIPLILSNITVPLLGITNTYIAGHLNSTQIMAAIALGAMLFDYLYWPFGFLRVGTVALVSQAYGANDSDHALRIIHHNIATAITIGLLLIVFEPLLTHFGFSLLSGDPQVKALVKEYLSIRIWSAPAVLINSVLVGSFIGLQNTKRPLIITATINVLATLLGLQFTFGWHWSLQGVALADVIGQYSGAIIGLVMLLKTLRTQGYGTITWSKFDTQLIVKLFAVNRDMFLRTILLIGSFAIFSFHSLNLGPLYLAANTVILHMLMLQGNIQDGFISVTETMIGEQVGRRDYQRATRVMFDCWTWAVIITLASSSLYLMFGQSLVNFMTDLRNVQVTATHFLIFAKVMPLITLTCFFLDGAFIGAARFTEMRNTMVLSFLSYLLLCWMLVPYGNYGIWFSLMGFFASRGLFMTQVFFKQQKQQRFFFRSA